MKNQKIRIFRPGGKALLFHEVTDVTITVDGTKWLLNFEHSDYIRKGEYIRSRSTFNSESCQGFTLIEADAENRSFASN